MLQKKTASIDEQINDEKTTPLHTDTNIVVADENTAIPTLPRGKFVVVERGNFSTRRFR